MQIKGSPFSLIIFFYPRCLRQVTSRNRFTKAECFSLTDEFQPAVT